MTDKPVKLRKINTNNQGKTPEQYKQAAKDIAEGKSIYKSLKDNGWSEGQAKKGRASLSGPILSELKKQGVVLMKIGKEASLEDQKNLVLGRLITNVAAGTDGGSASAKLLGSQKDLNMFTPENAQGQIVINALAMGNIEADLSRLSEPD